MPRSRIAQTADREIVMSSAKLGLKAAALVGAVLCVGAFVAYRAGAFSAAPSPHTTSPHSQSSDVPGSGSGSGSDPSATPPTFLGGSKSIVIIDPPGAVLSGTPATPPAPKP